MFHALSCCAGLPRTPATLIIQGDRGDGNYSFIFWHYYTIVLLYLLDSKVKVDSQKEERRK